MLQCNVPFTDSLTSDSTHKDDINTNVSTHKDDVITKVSTHKDDVNTKVKEEVAPSVKEED